MPANMAVVIIIPIKAFLFFMTPALLQITNLLPIYEYYLKLTIASPRIIRLKISFIYLYLIRNL